MKMALATCAMACLLASCLDFIPAERTSDKEYTVYDKRTSFAIQEEADGFTVHSFTEVREFVMNEEDLIKMAKANTMAIAFKYAEEQGRDLQPINEQRFTFNVGQAWTGNYSCACTIRVFWK
jgi:hypothetical protein